MSMMCCSSKNITFQSEASLHFWLS